jgi:hypothetical protein
MNSACAALSTGSVASTDATGTGCATARCTTPCCRCALACATRMAPGWPSAITRAAAGGHSGAWRTLFELLAATACASPKRLAYASWTPGWMPTRRVSMCAERSSTGSSRRPSPGTADAEVRRWLERAGGIRGTPHRTPAYVSGCSTRCCRVQRARCSSIPVVWDSTCETLAPRRRSSAPVGAGCRRPGAGWLRTRAASASCLPSTGHAGKVPGR